LPPNSTGAIADGVGTGLARQVRRAERRRLLGMLALMAPSVVFVALLFAVPIALFLFRSVDNSEIRGYLPRTVEAMATWDGQGTPPPQAFSALAGDLRALGDTSAVSLLGRRLNYAMPGYRALILRTARNLPDPATADMSAAMIDAAPQWAEAAPWAILKQQSGPLTSFYLLAALDLERGVDGAIHRVADDRALFIGLYGRTLLVSLGTTLICLVLGFPVAAVMAQARPATASWLLMLVLIPFWTSLLVRTTAWVVLLQNQGPVNKLLAWLGLIEQPLALIFNRTGVYIAMVQVLLPYMILPLYSVMKGISPTHLRAAASLGARPLRAFRTVYLPLTAPGIAAGATLVFVLSVGFYVTPALVGGPGDQMIGYFIAYLTNSAVNWGLASALGALLLLLVALLYAALGRLVGFERLRVR
jgi:putative spermidine/putrescine transport system permease protein